MMMGMTISGKNAPLHWGLKCPIKGNPLYHSRTYIYILQPAKVSFTPSALTLADQSMQAQPKDTASTITIYVPSSHQRHHAFFFFFFLQLRAHKHNTACINASKRTAVAHTLCEEPNDSQLIENKALHLVANLHISVFNTEQKLKCSNVKVT